MYEATSLFADDVPYTHITGTLLDPNAALKRGTVLGIITATGKWTVSAAAANDGSQVPRGVLAFDIPDPGADIATAIYDQGSFVSEKLIYGTGHTAATVEAALRAASINMRLKSVGAYLPNA
jgi:hypothetical protein